MGRKLTFRGALRRIQKRQRLLARVQKLIAKIDAEGPVPPCPRCGSTEGCRSDCPVAPWNLED